MEQRAVVLGAGVSGLVAAIELEKAGFSPLMIDQNARVGGRLATQHFQGLPLDVGFQVLLSEYPAAKEYLDFKKLDLVNFLPGSILHEGQKTIKWGDPLRDGSFFWSGVQASFATLTDKLKIFKLQRALKRTSIDHIFEKTELTTAEYLKLKGFSEGVINSFFKPFFTGIFLETELSTSSRMFEFVFKMFAEGKAVIPKDGIVEIALQLRSQLKKTTFLMNQEVIGLSNGHVILADGQVHEFDFCISTVPKEDQKVKWKSCDNLYFKTEKSSLDAPIIGLLTSPDRLVNNYHFVTDLVPHNIDGAVMSVTVVRKHHYTHAELVQAVSQEMKKTTGLKEFQFIKHFYIPKALPAITDLSYIPKSIHKEQNVYYTGDTTVQGSLNSAMLAGKQTALQAIKDLSLVSQ